MRLILFFVKNTEFLRHSGHKTAAAFVSDFGLGGFGCGGGGVRAWNYDANGGGGGDRRRRTS